MTFFNRHFQKTQTTPKPVPQALLTGRVGAAAEGKCKTMTVFKTDTSFFVSI
jgi:hypothetical protein